MNHNRMSSCLLLKLPKDMLGVILSNMSSMTRHCLRQTCTFFKHAIPPEPIDVSLSPALPVTLALEQLKGLRRVNTLCGEREDEWKCRALSRRSSLAQLLLVQAVKYGQFDDVKKLLSLYSNLEMNEAILEAAMWYGDVAHLERMIALDMEQRRRSWYHRRALSSLWHDEHLRIAIRCNHENMVRYLFHHVDRYQGLYCDWGHIAYAIGTQNESLLNMVEAHLNRNASTNSYYNKTFYKQLVAIENMDWMLQMIDRYHLHDKDAQHGQGYLIGYAAASGNKTLVNTLHQLKFTLSAETMRLACQRADNHEMVALLLSLQCPCDYTAYSSLFTTSSFENTAALLYQHACPLNATLYDGSFHIPDCTCNSSSLRSDRCYRNITEAQYHWLVEHQCPLPLTQGSIRQAFKYHSIPALQWLVNHHMVIELTMSDIRQMWNQPALWTWYQSYCHARGIPLWRMMIHNMYKEMKKYLVYGGQLCSYFGPVIFMLSVFTLVLIFLRV